MNAFLLSIDSESYRVLGMLFISPQLYSLMKISIVTIVFLDIDKLVYLVKNDNFRRVYACSVPFAVNPTIQ